MAGVDLGNPSQLTISLIIHVCMYVHITYIYTHIYSTYICIHTLIIVFLCNRQRYKHIFIHLSLYTYLFILYILKQQLYTYHILLILYIIKHTMI